MKLELDFGNRIVSINTNEVFSIDEIYSIVERIDPDNADEWGIMSNHVCTCKKSKACGTPTLENYLPSNLSTTGSLEDLESTLLKLFK